MKSVVALLVVLLSACAAPGSSIGRVALSGTAATQGRAEPLALEVTLPKQYGLGGLDLVMNKPEDFGHKNQTVNVEVEDGHFSFQFPPVVYHMTFWLLPPLGAFPKHPPEPVYFVRFSDTPDEVYLIGFDRGAFKYKVFGRKSRQELKPEEATWTFSHGKYVPVEEKEGDVWHLRVEASRSDKTLNPTSKPPLRSGAAAG